VVVEDLATEQKLSSQKVMQSHGVFALRGKEAHLQFENVEEVLCDVQSLHFLHDVAVLECESVGNPDFRGLSEGVVSNSIVIGVPGVEVVDIHNCQIGHLGKLQDFGYVEHALVVLAALVLVHEVEAGVDKHDH